MAGRGPAPKPTRSRPNDNARRESEMTKIAADETVRGPELPAEFGWCDRTRDWWETWRHSAQAQSMTATDWEFMLETAALHHEFWEGNTSLAGELRLRVAKFGATMEDRLRLRMQIESEATAQKSTSTRRDSSADRRRRLLKVVDGQAG